MAAKYSSAERNESQAIADFLDEEQACSGGIIGLNGRVVITEKTSASE